MKPESRTSRSENADAVSGSSVLIVDDDGQILALVARFLRSNGFDVRTARNGAEMLATLESFEADLIILDVMLPGMDGLALCREIRKVSDVPLIMLTAKGDEVDRIVGLELGADDYLVKPFNPRELLARINAVLRRFRQPASAAAGKQNARLRTYIFAGWSLDTLKRELTSPSGVVVDLSTGEYDLLMTFLEAPQRVLSREYLLDAARNRSMEPYDRAIDVQVSRVRRKFGEHANLIKTVRGAGYIFAASVDRQ
jgi:two-component system, OmpR family, response regulator